MSVKKEPSGRRSIQVEVEVPGTPEQVWQAIASGPGISAWFVPTKVEGRAGGSITCSFGPGMDSSAKITAWDPPRRMAAENAEGWMPGAPPLATEWTVEARAGGTCIVRVVHSMFASTDDWDNQLESTEQGWPSFFRVLRLYLAHHAGQKSALVQVMACPSGDTEQMWAKFQRALRVTSPKAGQKVRVEVPGAAPLAGTIERVDHAVNGHSLLVHVTEPVPGAGLFGAHDCGGMVMATVSLYLYGPAAEAAATRDQAAWQQWLAQTFPAAPAS